MPLPPTASVHRTSTTLAAVNVTYVVKKKHNLTFGFGYRRMQKNTLSYANSRENLTEALARMRTVIEPFVVARQGAGAAR